MFMKPILARGATTIPVPSALACGSSCAGSLRGLAPCDRRDGLLRRADEDVTQPAVRRLVLEARVPEEVERIGRQGQRRLDDAEAERASQRQGGANPRLSARSPSPPPRGARVEERNDPADAALEPALGEDGVHAGGRPSGDTTMWSRASTRRGSGACRPGMVCATTQTKRSVKSCACGIRGKCPRMQTERSATPSRSGSSLPSRSAENGARPRAPPRAGCGRWPGQDEQHMIGGEDREGALQVAGENGTAAPMTRMASSTRLRTCGRSSSARGVNTSCGPRAPGPGRRGARGSAPAHAGRRGRQARRFAASVTFSSCSSASSVNRRERSVIP